MKRFLSPLLTVPELEELGGDYEGVIADVTEELLHNRFKAQKTREAVISFYDGKRLVLNRTMLRACIGWFGDQSENWEGRRIRVFLRREEKVKKETGETYWRVQGAICCEDPHARAPRQRRTTLHPGVERTGEREPGEDDLDGD